MILKTNIKQTSSSSSDNSSNCSCRSPLSAGSKMPRCSCYPWNYCNLLISNTFWAVLWSRTSLWYSGRALSVTCCVIWGWGYRIFGRCCNSNFLWSPKCNSARRSLYWNGCSSIVHSCTSFHIRYGLLSTFAISDLRFSLSKSPPFARFCRWFRWGVTSAIWRVWRASCRCCIMRFWGLGGIWRWGGRSAGCSRILWKIVALRGSCTWSMVSSEGIGSFTWGVTCFWGSASCSFRLRLLFYREWWLTTALTEISCLIMERVCSCGFHGQLAPCYASSKLEGWKGLFAVFSWRFGVVPGTVQISGICWIIRCRKETSGEAKELSCGCLGWWCMVRSWIPWKTVFGSRECRPVKRCCIAWFNRSPNTSLSPLWFRPTTPL